MTHSRRNFIRLASKYSLGGVVFSSLPLSAIAEMRRPVSPNQKLNFGLIGANGMGWSNMRAVGSKLSQGGNHGITVDRGGCWRQ